MLVLTMLMPAAQVSIYSLKQCGFLNELGLSGITTHADNVPVGVLINERDNMSYASWAEQAKLGRYLASDLYTTEPHPAIYFNPYFAAMGVLSRILNLPPFIVMVMAAMLASGPFGFLVYRIGRQVGLSELASSSAAAVTLFGSGPSWVLFLLHVALGYTGAGGRPFLGLDGFYFDAFPVTTFIAYPFSAFSLLVVAAAVFFVNRAVSCNGELSWRTLLPATAACAIAALVRPYDGVLFCFLFPLFLIYRERCRPGAESLRPRQQIFSPIVILILLPVCTYIFGMTHLPVWREFASASLYSGPSRGEIIVGFSTLWSFACLGMYRALRERNGRVLFLVAWTSTLMLLTILVGGAVARFLSGSTISAGILAVYGIDGLRQSNGRIASWTFKVGAILVASTGLTSVCDYISILIQKPPTIEAEIKNEALVIPTGDGEQSPIVLIGCDAGLYLPGIAGLRVFAGHWSLTPNYKAKCRMLEEAGLTERRAEQEPDSDILVRLVRDVHPDYVILPTGSLAEARLLATGLGKKYIAGRKWSTMRVGP